MKETQVILFQRGGSFGPYGNPKELLHQSKRLLPSYCHRQRQKCSQAARATTVMFLSPAMVFSGCVLVFFILVSFQWTGAVEDEWRSATATYSKETNASIVLEGACGYGDLHRASYGKYSAGLSTGLFNRGSTCGACFEVRCVDHILWCLPGSPSVILTATDFCPPNYGLPSEYGGWCNYPMEHFEMSEAAFGGIAEMRADIVPVQYRRVNCIRNGGIRFTISGSSHFFQVVISNVGSDGEVTAAKVKGSRTSWMTLGRNWGQTWQCNTQLIGQPLSFEVTTSSGRTITSYGVSPSKWQFGQTFEGKQF